MGQTTLKSWIYFDITNVIIIVSLSTKVTKRPHCEMRIDCF